MKEILRLAKDIKMASIIKNFPIRVYENGNIGRFFVLLTITVFTTQGCVSTNKQKGQLAFETEQALMSDIAANAIGVNTHINYTGSVYDVHYSDIIKPRLSELGIRNIRDHFGNSSINARFQELAHIYGIKLLLINGDAGAGLKTTQQEVKRLNNINLSKPVVEYIEPANERDNGWKNPDGTTDWDRLCTYMQDYYKTFKQDQSTAGIPLLGPSFANTKISAVAFSAACSNAYNLMDIGNTHAYSGLNPENPIAGGWGISLNEAILNYRKLCGSKPIIDSESGYKMSSGQTGHPAVSERTAAKYSPRLVLARLMKGVEKVYFYQLINNSEDFGLLNIDGTPRLQYTALKNFIQLMADPGNIFTPGSLSYNLSGNLTDIRHLLFQKRDGRLFLLVWQGVNCSSEGTDNSNYTDINNPDRNITLNLGSKASSIKLYRPTFNNLPDGNGTSAIETYRNTSSINIAVPDHILVVEISKNKIRHAKNR